MIQPLKNHILLQKIAKEKKTVSGIILSTKDEEQENIGKVIAVGKETQDIKVGQAVIFEKYKGTEVKYQNEDYIVINVKDALATVNLKG